MKKNPKLSRIEFLNLSPASIGCIQELKVCIDLLVKGFHVFRAVSAACYCDLIATKNNKTYQIEVRTGRLHKVSGRLHYAKQRIGVQFVAIVCRGKITYKPELI